MAYVVRLLSIIIVSVQKYRAIMLSQYLISHVMIYELKKKINESSVIISNLFGKLFNFKF